MMIMAVTEASGDRLLYTVDQKAAQLEEVVLLHDRMH
jgi:hypothetical protein